MEESHEECRKSVATALSLLINWQKPDYWSKKEQDNQSNNKQQKGTRLRINKGNKYNCYLDVLTRICMWLLEVSSTLSTTHILIDGVTSDIKTHQLSDSVCFCLLPLKYHVWILFTEDLELPRDNMWMLQQCHKANKKGICQNMFKASERIKSVYCFRAQVVDTWNKCRFIKNPSSSETDAKSFLKMQLCWMRGSQILVMLIKQLKQIAKLIMIKLFFYEESFSCRKYET